MTIACVAVPEMLSLESVRALAGAVTSAVEDPAARLVVLEGSATVFCRGLDMEQLVGAGEGQTASEIASPQPAAAAAAFVDCLRRIALASKPTLARVAGPALGGGVGLAAACDVVLAEENASFALPELLFGLTPAIILPLLLQRMSVHQVRLWALRGSAYDARAAYAAGLVDEVVEAGQGDAACRRWERALGRAEPRAVAQLKRHLAEEGGWQAEALRRGAARTAAALADEAVLGPLRAFWQDGTPPWEER